MRTFILLLLLTSCQPPAMGGEDSLCCVAPYALVHSTGYWTETELRDPETCQRLNFDLGDLCSQKNDTQVYSFDSGDVRCIRGEWMYTGIPNYLDEDLKR